MRTISGIIMASVMAVALGESALAELPPQANSSVTNAATVMEVRQMVSALWQCDGNVRYREYPGEGHGCWIPTYNDTQVLDWFFTQSKTSEQR